MEETVDLAALQAKLRGCRFGEVILHHFKDTDLQETMAVNLHVRQKLPRNAQPLLESWIDEMNVGARSEQFWQQDCRDAFGAIIAAAAAKLRAAGLGPSSDDLSNMFQVIVWNFVYGAHRIPPFKALVEKSLGAVSSAGPAERGVGREVVTKQERRIARVHFASPDGDYVAEVTIGVDVPADVYEQSVDRDTGDLYGLVYYEQGVRKRRLVPRAIWEQAHALGREVDEALERKIKTFLEHGD